MTDPRILADAFPDRTTPPLPPYTDRILKLAEIIGEVADKHGLDHQKLAAGILGILAHPGFSGCHDCPADLPAQGEVEDRYEFSVVDSDDCEQAGGSAPTLEDAIREGRNYLCQYNQDGPHKLELRHVLMLDYSEPTDGHA